jgi:hypothetical protein
LCPKLARVSAAIQKQVLNDFGPVWNIQATVDAFADLAHIPPGYWHVILEDDIGSTDAGLHKDENNQPFALVAYTEGWQLAASHEILEMLVDPSGNAMKSGLSVMPDQGPVSYLLEICDPCAGVEFSYRIDGVPVCDFCTPDYYESTTAPVVRYDFRGAISRPLQVLKGGYLSWNVAETGEWWQQVFFGAESQFIRRPQLTLAPRQSLRSVIDRLPSELREQQRGCYQDGCAGVRSHECRGRVSRPVVPSHGRTPAHSDCRVYWKEAAQISATPAPMVGYPTRRPTQARPRTARLSMLTNSSDFAQIAQSYSFQAQVQIG